MDKILRMLCAVVFTVILLGQNVYADVPHAKGYYDEQNEWFVFEWERPNKGIVQGILDPPNKVKPSIKSNVMAKGKSAYTYQYEIGNKEGAMQLLYNIYIPHMASIFDAIAPHPNDEWYMGEYRDKGIWHWAKTGGEVQGIPAGAVVEGFSFKSEGPPIIVKAIFVGERRKRIVFPGDNDTEDAAVAIEKIYRELKEKYSDKFKEVAIKTIGPGEIPKDFNALTFIDSIITMKHEAAKLGWITNDGIIKSLDAKLDNAKKAIAGNNMTSAKNLLEAFIKEVEAQGCPTIDDCPKGKHLSSEAYALLKYNVLYLLDRL